MSDKNSLHKFHISSEVFVNKYNKTNEDANSELLELLQKSLDKSISLLYKDIVKSLPSHFTGNENSISITYTVSCNDSKANDTAIVDLEAYSDERRLFHIGFYDSIDKVNRE